jgi:urease accessory protein
VGPAAVRIREEDFLTPPEFRGLRLASSPIGQIGGLRLELIASGGKTRLGECFQQIPLRVMKAFHFAGERAALLYILNPTVGLLDGDAHRIELVVREGCRAVVAGQSANRIHPAQAGFSTQQWHIRVEAGAELVVLPGPAIPYRGCRYYQHARIDLVGDARLIWGDIWLPGRYARGAASELHAFDTVVQDVEVRRDGALVYRDRFAWVGPWSAEEARWHLGDGLASGSVFVGEVVERVEVRPHPLTPSPKGEGGPEATPQASRFPEASGSPSPLGEGAGGWGPPFTGVTPTILELASGDTLFRACGDPSSVTAELVRVALTQAGAWSDGAAWFSAANLGPNHWFSATHH